MKRYVTLIILLLALVAGIPPGRAGQLEPSAPPGPTMKPLTEVTSAWKSQITPVVRFELVFNDEAVFDRETGLVWQRTPHNNSSIWSGAVNDCIFQEVGGKLGWRLPTVEELLTLVDKSQSNPALPSGHPFLDVRLDDHYWTATTKTEPSGTTRYSYRVHFGGGSLFYEDKQTFLYSWCVRAGKGHNFAGQMSPNYVP
jgi:hypothetical protein